MNSSSFFSRAVGLLAAALLSAGIAPAQAQPTFSLEASAASVLPSQSFTVSVRASDVVDLFGYQFNIGFDPSLYSVTSVSAGPFLSSVDASFFSPGTIDNAAGSVSFVFETVLGEVGGVSGSGVLGTITLSALAGATGTGSIGLNDVSALSSQLELIELAPVAPVTVSVVPEPAAWAMMSLGLVGVLALRRRRPYDHPRA